MWDNIFRIYSRRTSNTNTSINLQTVIEKLKGFFEKYFGV